MKGHYNLHHAVASSVAGRLAEAIFRAKEKMAAHPWYTTAGVATASIFTIRKCCRYSMNECNCKTDLTGKTVVITDGNSGIGKATAMALARRNASVIIGCRNSVSGLNAAKEIRANTGNHNVAFKQMDFCSFDSVRNFASNMKEIAGGIHILINNSGMTDSGEKKLITEDGCEHMMQAHYLGPFLLTLSLADVMKKNAPSRIIMVSSPFYKFGELDVEDLQSEKEYNYTDVYSKSKLATVLSSTELSKKLEQTGVTVNAVSPGFVKTDFVKGSNLFHGFITRILFFFLGKTPFEGAQTILHVALSPELEKVSGKFFSNCKEKKLARVAQNEFLAKNLFKRTEDVVECKL